MYVPGMRRPHAVQLREEGLDIGIIFKQLGRRSIATTARYLDHICPLAVVGGDEGESVADHLPFVSPVLRRSSQTGDGPISSRR